MAIDQHKMEEFLGKFVTDLGASVSVSLAALGDKLGLYDALSVQRHTAATLAATTGYNARYLQEWLLNQAASGYISFDPVKQQFYLSAEQTEALTNESSPFFIAGGFQVAGAANKAWPVILECFRQGGGLAWENQDQELFEGTERFFRPVYVGNLVQSWIPALSGVKQKLEAGAVVADIGCGHGASTILLSQAFPKSKFFGYDKHVPSIARAREAAVNAGVGGRVFFEDADADSFPAQGYDLVAFFDCFHDLPKPQAALKRAFDALKPGGTLMLVEPVAGETIQDNLNPVGRVFSGASTLVCLANGMVSGQGLGAVAPDSAYKTMIEGAGFKSFRRATATPFNRVFEAKK